jgi:hypothetical protein
MVDQQHARAALACDRGAVQTGRTRADNDRIEARAHRERVARVCRVVGSPSFIEEPIDWMDGIVQPPRVDELPSRLGVSKRVPRPL